MPLAGQLAPRRIFFYRDGVGVSQFPIIKQREVPLLIPLSHHANARGRRHLPPPFSQGLQPRVAKAATPCSQGCNAMQPERKPSVPRLQPPVYQGCKPVLMCIQVAAIRRACLAIGGEQYKPKLVFVVVQKRNHCRHNPNPDPNPDPDPNSDPGPDPNPNPNPNPNHCRLFHEADGQIENALPGTVVDSAITTASQASSSK